MQLVYIYIIPVIYITVHCINKFVPLISELLSIQHYHSAFLWALNLFMQVHNFLANVFVTQCMHNSVTTILTQSYCMSHIVSGEHLKSTINMDPREMMMIRKTLNIASIPPATNTERVGFMFLYRILIKLPIFAAFHFSMTFLFTLFEKSV